MHWGYFSGNIYLECTVQMESGGTRMYDLRPFINQVEALLARHFLSRYNVGYPGAYARWTIARGRLPETLGINPYGCADAANLIYTLQPFPSDPAQRLSWVRILQGLQDPGDGLFHEETHHPIHTTAHCIAALELFDARPIYPLIALRELLDAEHMVSFLESLDWAGDPWSASHQGAGLYAALVLTGEASEAWQRRYFSWLWEQADPETGLFRVGHVGPAAAGGVESIFPHLAGTFHYLFNLQYARMPLRYPEALVDTCLDIFKQQVYPLGQSVGFAEIDWVYCLNRAVRQSGHRFEAARSALHEFAQGYLDYLLSLDPQTDPGLDDLHALFGTVCCLAELQQTLPGFIQTRHPLRLVLDRRPFI